MEKTRIFFTTDKARAEDTVRNWLIETEGARGVSIASTGGIIVSHAGDPFNAEWETEGEGPWYVVVATKDPIAFDVSGDAGDPLI